MKSKTPKQESFAQQTKRMAQKDMVPLSYAVKALEVKEIASAYSQYADKASDNEPMSAAYDGGPIVRKNAAYFDSKQSVPVMEGVAEIGTKGFGYIPYGPFNSMPNTMYKIAQCTPYTAVAMEYNTDVKVGMGPRLMYHGSIYQNGRLESVCYPYAQAGEWLQGRIMDTLTKIDALQPKQNGMVLNTQQESAVLAKLKEQLARLEQDYTIWQQTEAERTQFEKNSNLDMHFLKCMQDDSFFDLYYPAIILEKGKPRHWEPKIIGVGHIPTMTVRMEQMDEKWHINHVYHSERWRKDATAKLEAQDVVAYPCLMPDRFFQSLQEVVDKNHRTPVKQRPALMVCPSFYPSAGKPYYPIPVWFSLLCSKVLEYASTLIYDKATAKANSNCWGKIAYINLTYFKQICDAEGLDTQDAREAKKVELQNAIDEFLKRKENNGKLMVTDSFLTEDEKNLYKAIEIVDVPQETNAKETKDELEEISSIILFTFKIHPSLIGATPGKTPTTGGTQQRELFLLKEIMESPRVRLYFQFLNNCVHQNHWDSHAVYEIQLPVLTTLDRNSNGIEITNPQ